MDQREFFKNIFRDGTGRAVLVLPNGYGNPTKDTWFEYPAQLDDMAKFANQNSHQAVWFSPVLFNEDSRTKASAKSLAVVAADADTCDPSNFRMEPSIIVQTSPGRWHVYWGLDKSYDAHEVAKVNRRLAQVHKDEGCDTAFVNAAKLLRVPNTSNNKHPGAVVAVVDDSGKAYKFSVISDNLYPESEIADAQEGPENVPDMPDDLMEFIEANRNALLNSLPNSNTLRELLFGKFSPDRRSEVRFKLLCELYGLGMNDESVMALAWYAPSNKYREDSRGVGGLWAEAMKAKQIVRPGDDTTSEGDPEREQHQERKTERKRTSFIKSDEEHEIIKQHITFIDSWVTWAGTKTDAPREYHRAAAMSLMSTVYSEFGHAIPKFAPKGLKLNMWFMVLGRSTKDRKSTSRSYMNAALRELKTEDYNYMLGDDVTPGGISLALHDRANRASVFDRDEVQGLFKELLHQSYMSGGLEVFTKLYDGWSGGRVRASGDKKIMESVPVSFIMFLMGILSETTDVLTITNYRSGFLTRFLYVLAERPDGFKATPMEQASPEDEGEDKAFKSLVRHLEENRNFWEMRGDRGDTHPLRVDADAWKRFQEFEMDAQMQVSESQYAEIIGTTTDRMIISTLKLACLIAMDERSLTVKMHHMLQAIAYAGDWYDNAVTVASMVSASEWQRDVDKLEEYINGRGGSVSYAMAYRQFKDKKPGEFEEMVGALVQRGVIRRVQSGTKWVLESTYGED